VPSQEKPVFLNSVQVSYKKPPQTINQSPPPPSQKKKFPKISLLKMDSEIGSGAGTRKHLPFSEF